jgi:hypothetical protein
MTKATQVHATAYTPRLLRRERAAAYLDVSPNKFDQMVKTGGAPQPKFKDGLKWWDRADLDSFADHLPYADSAHLSEPTWE